MLVLEKENNVLLITFPTFCHNFTETSKLFVLPNAPAQFQPNKLIYFYLF